MHRYSRVAPPALASWVAALIVLAVGASYAGRAHAAVSCAPSDATGVERCVAGLAPAALHSMYQPQQASNWCWAASIAMVLRRYGMNVAQEQVVRAQFGQAENLRVSAETIGALLTRGWDDDAGRHASASVMLLPPWRRALGFAAPEVLDDLAGAHPLLVQTRHHAMLLVQVVYERRSDGGAIGPAGVRVLSAAVLDPASGLHLRSLDEGDRPEYLARVRVQVSAPVHGASAAAGALSVQ